MTSNLTRRTGNLSRLVIAPWQRKIKTGCWSRSTRLHIHVRKDGADVKVLLLQKQVKLHNVKGKLSAAKIREAGTICSEHLDECWRVWRKYYG